MLRAFSCLCAQGSRLAVQPVDTLKALPYSQTPPRKSQGSVWGDPPEAGRICRDLGFWDCKRNASPPLTPHSLALSLWLPFAVTPAVCLFATSHQGLEGLNTAGETGSGLFWDPRPPPRDCKAPTSLAGSKPARRRCLVSSSPQRSACRRF